MAEKRDVIVVGAFPQTFEDCRDAGWNVIGTTDYEMTNVGDVRYLGADEDFIANTMSQYPNAQYVATPDSPRIRRKIIEQYSAHGAKFATIIATTAKISPQAKLGEGTMVQHAGTIQACCKIGKAVRVNVNGAVMHHSILGDYVTVAPGAMILGYVEIGEGSYIGANATILPRIKIGKNVTIGAGAVVTHNVPDNEIWAGVPAIRLK